MLQIFCKNINVSKSFPEGSSLLDIYAGFEADINNPYPVVGAKVNNVSQGLKFRVYHNKEVEFVDVTEPSGMRAYSRSLCFVFYKAVVDCFPDSKLNVEHPISRGYFASMEKSDGTPITSADVTRIKERMQEIIAFDMPFRRNEVQTDEAVRVFKERGFMDKVKLLETGGQIYSDYYTLGDTVDYYYGCLLPSAGYLTVWGLETYHHGLLLRIPDATNPNQLAPMTDQPKTFGVFAENLKWNSIMHLENVGDVNHACLHGNASELIQVAEALQEKKIVKIAEEIERRRHTDKPVRVVLITGPSSSGKTTFSKRLSIQLLACGIRPYAVSTDDYFVNRVDTPKFPDGRYDFENLLAVDLPTFNRDLQALLNGETVEVPEYNFNTGKREYNGKHVQLDQNSILVLEGIHALNPELTKQIPDEVKFRIYVSALTSVSLDDHNWIPTSDNRLLRRIIRDYYYRGFSARETINQWPAVLAGEEKWIYPYQENADVMFNSALIFEFAVLRNHAEAILSGVPKNCPEYSEAHRLLHFIHYFVPVSDKEIPPTSLLREFLGGSSFKY